MAKKNIEVKVYLTPEQFVAVQAAANEDGRSVSAFLRIAGMDHAVTVLQGKADQDEAA